MDILKKAITPVPYEIFERLQLAHRGPKLPKLRRAGVLDRRQPSGQRIYSWNNKLFQTKVRGQGKSRSRSPAARSGVEAVAVHKISEGWSQFETENRSGMSSGTSPVRPLHNSLMRTCHGLPGEDQIADKYHVFLAEAEKR